MRPERLHTVFVGVTVALAFAMPLTAIAAGASVYALLLGGLSWLAAVALKLLAAWPVRRLMRWPSQMGRPYRLASLTGALSATTELGAAGLLFPYQDPGADGVATVLAFGLGAWACEVLSVVPVSWAVRLRDSGNAERQQAYWLTGAEHSLWVRGAALWERIAALANHVGARCTLVTAVLCGVCTGVAIAWLGFAAVDGAASYGHLAGWNWFDPVRLRRYYTFAFIMGGIQLLSFVALRVAC